MRSQRLGQVMVGVLVLAPCFGSLPVSAEVVREGTCAGSQELFPDSNPGPGTLKALRPRSIPGLATYVRDRRAAIALGKALFWDMQVGSDGIQSCGSCHFRAGADPRSINQANPGGANNPDLTVNFGINHELSAADFPLHQLADPTSRSSQILRDNDDVISSQGVKLSRFLRAVPGADKDVTVPVPDEVFNINGLNSRRAEPRNTPTVINAAFNRDAFWDGRAETVFNGVSVFGVRDPNAQVLKAGDDSMRLVKIRIDHAALASQAVGPPLSDREMGSLGRTFYDVGKRLVSARPLAKQKVDRKDSVLADYRNDDGHDARGLEGTYGNCEVVAYDQSYYNLSVRPFEEDSGLGTADPFGNPGALIDILTTPPALIPSAELLTQPMINIANPAIAMGERTSTRSFKTPLLRNIELTAPYFHNGGQGTLLQVVNFYNQGGDFREHNAQFIDFEIGKLNLTAQDLDDLVAFLKGLTDQRVLYRRAPFDSPQLFVPNGHRVVNGVAAVDTDGTAADIMLEVPAVGRNGGPPLKGFLKQ